MLEVLITLLVITPFVLYIVVTFTADRGTDDPDTFFLARGKITSLDFTNTSVAYGFQIASVSIFFAWGFHYGIGAFVNPFFWGLGILFFLSMLPRLTSFLGSAQTLHGFLGKSYQSHSVTILGAVMTLFGFLGAFTAELVWGSTVLSMVKDDPVFITITTSVMGLFVLFYVLRAGQVSVVKTDQFQLIFAHSSFVALLIALTSLMHWRGDTARAIGLLLSVVTLVLLLVVTRSIYRQLRFERSSVGGSGPTWVIFSLMAVGSLGALVNVILFFPAIGATTELLQHANLFSLDQGWSNLLSLALLPLCWQFADVTMWQRLSALQRNDLESDELLLQRIRLGLRRYAIESPAIDFFI